MGKSVTVPGKCYAISDGDRQDDPKMKDEHQILYQKCPDFSPKLQSPAVVFLIKKFIH